VPVNIRSSASRFETAIRTASGIRIDLLRRLLESAEDPDTRQHGSELAIAGHGSVHHRSKVAASMLPPDFARN